MIFNFTKNIQQIPNLVGHILNEYHVMIFLYLL